MTLAIAGKHNLQNVLIMEAMSVRQYYTHMQTFFKLIDSEKEQQEKMIRKNGK